MSLCHSELITQAESSPSQAESCSLWSHRRLQDILSTHSSRLPLRATFGMFSPLLPTLQLVLLSPSRLYQSLLSHRAFPLLQLTPYHKAPLSTPLAPSSSPSLPSAAFPCSAIADILRYLENLHVREIWCAPH